MDRILIFMPKKMQKKVLTLLLLFIICLSMSIQVLAASVSITFSLDGVTGYDSIITTSTVKAGSNSSIEISKIYCKTVQADDEVSIAKDYPYRIIASGFCYLNADETTNWSKKRHQRRFQSLRLHLKQMSRR